MRVLRISAVFLWAACTGRSLTAASLNDLMDEASHQNPDIAAALNAWQASAQLSTQVATLPDPQVTFQQLAVGSPRPFAGFSNSDFAYVGFGVSQDIPWPGKLRLRAEHADRDAAVSREKYEAIRRTIFQQVEAAYFQLGYLQSTNRVLERDQTLLEQIEKIAEARYRLGQGSQQDVLKAQLEKTKILNEIAHHHGLMKSSQAQLRKLLNRGAEGSDVTVDDLTETPLTFTANELLEKARTENPDINGEQEMVRKQSLQVEIARKDGYPDFSVQYMWQHTAEQYRDYYTLSVSARLPIYRKRKINPAITQAVSELDQSRREYESHLQQAFFDIRDQYASTETASEMLKIYREGLIPQTLATLRAGLAGYEAGKQDFETLLATYRNVLNFDEEYWKTLADRETSLSRIEQISGVRIH